MQIEQALGVRRIDNPQRKPECCCVSFTGDKAVKGETRDDGKIEELLNN